MPSETLTHGQASELYERLARKAAARNSRARRLRVVVKSGAGVAMVAVLVLGAVLATHWPGGRSSPRYEFTPTLRTHQSSKKMFGLGYREWEPRPLGGIGSSQAVSLSLDEARARAVFPVGVPTSDLVPESSIKDVWFLRIGKEGGHPEPELPLDFVAINYEHLQVLEEQMPSSYVGPNSYRGMVGEKADPGAYMGVVQSLPAYVAPPNIDADNQTHPGYIMFMKGNVQFIVEGYYSDSDLLAIANSIEWPGR